MPSKPSKGKSIPNLDPTSLIGLTMQGSLPTRADYSYLTRTISDKTLSNYTMITQPPDTPAT